MQKYPIGISSLDKILKDGYSYVDKTQFAWRMISRGQYYFLSRPRRFGKSLMVSTLNEIFKGNKALFKGLHMGTVDYDWQEYPVIRIDFGVTKELPLQEYILGKLSDVAKSYEIDLSLNDVYDRYFQKLIQALEAKYKKPVVILIDEYDKPILDVIDDLALATERREVLKGFYSVIKAQDEYVRFAFLTGVTKFAKTGVFSGLNNLKDITMNAEYAAICGLTEAELLKTYAEGIHALAESESLSDEASLDKIRSWYNGYRFSESSLSVYNPFSTLLLLENHSFKNYWFESGTPTFLIKLVQSQDFNMLAVENAEMKADQFSTFEIDSLDPMAILFQAGYLTIKGYHADFDTYVLNYPNYEVESSFKDILLRAYTHDKQAGISVINLIRLLQADKLEQAIELLKTFFANVPFSLQKGDKEYHYHLIFHCIFTLMGLRIHSEVQTNRGVIDSVVETKTAIYIFEFKLNDTKEAAISQIKTKEYYQKYQNTEKKLYLIGVEFDKKKRNVGEYLIEESTGNRRAVGQ